MPGSLGMHARSAQVRFGKDGSVPLSAGGVGDEPRREGQLPHPARRAEPRALPLHAAHLWCGRLLGSPRIVRLAVTLTMSCNQVPPLRQGMHTCGMAGKVVSCVHA